GTAALESGFLNFEGQSLTGGEFVVDLNQLQCADLQGSDLHDVLIEHLKSDDFFDVPNHPKVHFTITKAEPVEAAKPGGKNVVIGGDLTMRGKTNAIEFEAAAGLTEDGKPAAQAAFSIDRTRWGILYGSGKFFARLAGHIVNDEIEFQLKIVAK
ncbi:MAG: YceI family protein, partial [Verrucomicrobiota bacterium]